MAHSGFAFMVTDHFRVKTPSDKPIEYEGLYTLITVGQYITLEYLMHVYLQEPGMLG